VLLHPGGEGIWNISADQRAYPAYMACRDLALDGRSSPLFAARTLQFAHGAGICRVDASVHPGERQAALARVGEPEVVRLLTWRAVEGQVPAGTQSQAFSGLLFRYRQVLAVDLR
jgi:hypothetical protein